MKAILLSIKPKWVAKILNGEKIIEIRKTCPKCDLPINVYIYCTKDNHQLVKPKDYDKHLLFTKGAVNYSHEHTLNGKVVAKFTLNKVELITNRHRKGMLIDSCLSYDELELYLSWKIGYAWHISNLVIFDRPRELCEFHTNIKKEPPEELLCPECGKPMEYYEYKYLTKAPQSWCYVEADQ